MLSRGSSVYPGPCLVTFLLINIYKYICRYVTSLYTVLFLLWHFFNINGFCLHVIWLIGMFIVFSLFLSPFSHFALCISSHSLFFSLETGQDTYSYICCKLFSFISNFFSSKKNNVICHSQTTICSFSPYLWHKDAP